MNVNYEPAYLVMDFCRDVRKQDLQGFAREVQFDFNEGSKDRKDFMEWMETNPVNMRFLREHYGNCIETFLGQAVGEPEFSEAWAQTQPGFPKIIWGQSTYKEWEPTEAERAESRRKLLHAYVQSLDLSDIDGYPF
jgi:hypothetical protein